MRNVYVYCWKGTQAATSRARRECPPTALGLARSAPRQPARQHGPRASTYRVNQAHVHNAADAAAVLVVPLILGRALSLASPCSCVCPAQETVAIVENCGKFSHIAREYGRMAK